MEFSFKHVIPCMFERVTHGTVIFLVWFWWFCMEFSFKLVIPCMFERVTLGTLIFLVVCEWFCKYYWYFIGRVTKMFRHTHGTVIFLVLFLWFWEKMLIFRLTCHKNAPSHRLPYSENIETLVVFNDFEILKSKILIFRYT